MTETEFKMTSFYERMSYEEYNFCNCSQCKRELCPHRGAFRRHPKSVGGLGLCPNLKQKNEVAMQ